MAVNLRQLAKQLSLSPTTVSRALNGFPEVSEKTRKKVKLAAAEFGYVPSSHAKQLATGRSFAIGHVIALDNHQMIDPHFADFIAGANKIYAESGYHLRISTIPGEDEETFYRQLAVTRQVDGVILNAPRLHDPRIDLLSSLGLPFVVHGRVGPQISEASYAWVDVNNRRSFFRATNYLLDLRHERIGLINGPEHMNFAIRRRSGYEDALKARGVSLDPDLMFSEHMAEPYGFHATQKMLALESPPTALLCASIIPALGALRALQANNLKPGKDISIIAHDDDLAFLKDPSPIPLFTSLRSSLREAGEESAAMLLRQIEANDHSPKPEHLLKEAEFIVGESTGPR